MRLQNKSAWVTQWCHCSEVENAAERPKGNGLADTFLGIPEQLVRLPTSLNLHIAQRITKSKR